MNIILYTVRRKQGVLVNCPCDTENNGRYKLVGKKTFKIFFYLEVGMSLVSIYITNHH
jgi:hypothetical protein